MTPKSQPTPEWQVVYTTTSLPDAHIIAGRLQYEGIACWIHQPIGSNAIGITIGPLGTISVLVNPADYDDACDILYHEETDISAELPDFSDDYYISGLDDDDDQ